MVVVRSTTTIYGSSSRDPALFTEDMEPRQLPRGGYGKDAVEVEGYVRGFSRRRPDIAALEELLREQRAAYLRAVASSVAEGSLDLERLVAERMPPGYVFAPNPDEVAKAVLVLN